MNKLGFSILKVEEGEEIELKISSINVPHTTNVAQMPHCSLDGIGLEANVKGKTATYQFKVEKPVGESHEFIILFPDTALEDAEYEVELREAGRPVDYRVIKPTGRQPAANLIYTLSTHGSGGGSRG